MMDRTPVQNKPSARWMPLLHAARRIILMLIAFNLALLLLQLARIALSHALPLQHSGPVAAAVTERLPNSLLLLGSGLLLAFFMAPVGIAAAVLIHKLEDRVGLPGSVLKAIGRIWVFATSSTSPLAIAIVLVYVLGIRFKLLPLVGMFNPSTGGRNLGDRLLHLILPAITLALMPAMLTAQVVARRLTLPRSPGSGWQVWLSGALTGLKTLFGQTGGLIGALFLVEMIFAWPGVARLFAETVIRFDMNLLFGPLSAFAVLILIGRLIAEACGLIERMLEVPLEAPLLEPTHWRKTACIIWTSFALLSLLLPLGLAVAGLITRADDAIRLDAKIANASPSGEHPLGTDQMGRDMLARTLRGAWTTLGLAALLAFVLLIPGSLGGVLVGWLTAKKLFWTESLADVLLLPLDALRFIPPVGIAGMMVMLGRALFRTIQSGWLIAAVACTLALLPRAVYICQTLWLAAPVQHQRSVLALAGLGTAFTSMWFAATQLLVAIDVLGFGFIPPAITWGLVIREAFQRLVRQPAALWPAIVLAASTLMLYLAADALAGFFLNKEPLARLNE